MRREIFNRMMTEQMMIELSGQRCRVFWLPLYENNEANAGLFADEA
jgi:hypothetical protein